MTAAAEPAVLPDAGTCRWCPHGQWSHKRGKGGCRELDCICDRYGPPKDAPVPGVIENRPDDADPAVCVGGFEPAQPGDVDLPGVADPAAQAAYVEQVAAIDAQPAESDDDRLPCHRCNDLVLTLSSDGLCDGCVAEDDEAIRRRADVERLTVQLEQAYERVDELETELGRIYGALHIDRDRDAAEVIEGRRVRLRDAENDLLDVRGILAPNGYPSRIPADVSMVPAVAPAVQWLADRVDELTAERDQAAGAAKDAQRRAERLAGELDAAQAAIVRLSADLGRANADRQRARAAVDDAVRAGTAAAARVVRRYDAEQCETCGYRTTVPIDHEHPLEPVTVLIVRREVGE
ncbi:hypothetical protein [Micromonospora globbae]|uniref:hypothetical protein n=1 Tax=Micromonospora globbae TaxID=1894969 RepID=UPI00342E23E5